MVIRQKTPFSTFEFLAKYANFSAGSALLGQLKNWKIIVCFYNSKALPIELNVRSSPPISVPIVFIYQLIIVIKNFPRHNLTLKLTTCT